MKNALRALIVGSLLLAAGHAAAEQWSPSRPIEIVVPFAAGGVVDITMRTIAPSLSKRLGQPVVVVNKTGGAGTIGMNQVAKAAPDGHTLGAASFSFAANPAVVKDMPFDPLKDLTPITQVARASMLLLVNKNSPVHNVQEFIDWVKSKPGDLNFTSAGVGTTGHLMAELLLSRAGGLKMTHVPFTHGYAPLMQGHVHFLIGGIPAAMPWVKDGRLRAIAVTSLEPDSNAPGLETVSKTLPGFETFEWPALVGPKGMPREIIDRIQQEVVGVLNEPEIKAKFANLGEQPVGSTPDDFRRFIEEQMKTWADIGRHLSTMREATAAESEESK